VPRSFPKEFREDIVRVARDRGPGVTLEQIAHDFGIHPMTLSKWIRQSDIDDGVRPGRSTTESAELRAAFGFTSFRNHRIRSHLYAGKPNWDLLATVTPRRNAKSL